MRLQTITDAFYQNLKYFTANPKNYMAQYGGNIAGWLWNTGGVAQLALGTASLAPREVAAAITNLSASASSAFFGHKNWGVSTTCGLAVVGVGLSVYPSLRDFDPSAWLGYGTFCTSMALGFFSDPLTRKFSTAANALVRGTIGNARRLGFGMTFASRLPIIYSSIVANDRNTAIVFGVFALGDIAMSLSRPQPKSTPIDTHLQQPR